MIELVKVINKLKYVRDHPPMSKIPGSFAIWRAGLQQAIDIAEVEFECFMNELNFEMAGGDDGRLR